MYCDIRYNKKHMKRGTKHQKDLLNCPSLLRRACGFTLIELLIVIALIAVLSSIVLSSLNSGREKSRVAAGKQQDSALYRALSANATAIWNFDEGSGSVILDASGNNNSGSYSGAIWNTDTPYGRDYSLTFNNGASASFPNVSGLPSDKVTVTAWVYLTTHRNWNNFVNNNWVGNGWIIYSDITGKAVFGIGQGGTQYGAGYSTPLALNRWYFLAGTYDGAQATLYIDGKRDGNVVSLANAAMTNSGNITVGPGTIGSVDQVRIYARPLSAMEIERLYAEGKSPERLTQGF
jgi:prepilin-type N-terminal cleavage/methylation domain-containing protein